MRMIISPAKQMREDAEGMAPLGFPVYLNEAQELLTLLKSKSLEELKELWQCNDVLAQQNFRRLQYMELDKACTSAIEAYDGIQYKYMAPKIFENGEFSYVQQHLRILSGFYGVLKPLDAVAPYRLEMQAKLNIGVTKLQPKPAKNLYAYWQDKLYREVADEDHVILNLASKEYSKAVEKFLQPQDIYITCVFGEIAKGKVVQKGVYAKMARGEMVRFMAERNINDPEAVKDFNYLEYSFSQKHSSDREYVFLR